MILAQILIVIIAIFLFIVLADCDEIYAKMHNRSLGTNA